jgi:uncharacterized membrane protein
MPSKPTAAAAKSERAADLHPAEPAAPHPYVAASRAATLAGLAALTLLCVAWELWLAPTGSGTLALKALPLALCAFGLWRHRMYTYRWLAMLVWLYFLEGVTRAWTDSGISQALAVLEIVLSLVLFATSSFYIRWRLRQGKALAAEQALAGTAGEPLAAPAGSQPTAGSA